jgi:hypothetical protein
MEARINKIITHLTQKGFVDQILDNAKLQFNSRITDKLSMFSFCYYIISFIISFIIYHLLFQL